MAIYSTSAAESTHRALEKYNRGIVIMEMFLIMILVSYGRDAEIENMNVSRSTQSEKAAQRSVTPKSKRVDNLQPRITRPPTASLIAAAI